MIPTRRVKLRAVTGDADDEYDAVRDYELDELSEEEFNKRHFPRILDGDEGYEYLRDKE